MTYSISVRVSSRDPHISPRGMLDRMIWKRSCINLFYHTYTSDQLFYEANENNVIIKWLYMEVYLYIEQINVENTQFNFHIKSLNYFIFVPHKAICRKYMKYSASRADMEASGWYPGWYGKVMYYSHYNE